MSQTYLEPIRTPAPGCPACEGKRIHTPAERAQFHPFAGHGFARGQGWSHPELDDQRRAQQPQG
jgi:hypothetical protein